MPLLTFTVFFVTVHCVFVTVHCVFVTIWLVKWTRVSKTGKRDVRRLWMDWI